MNAVTVPNLQAHPARLGWVALALLAPPFLFLAVIIVVSIYVGATSAGDPEAIASQVSQLVPQQLLIVQVLLLLLLGWIMRANQLSLRDMGWALPDGGSLWRELLLGAGVGLGLGLLYSTILAPIMATLQSMVGDYVPAGELLSSLGTAALPFFVANVLLAPLVEETLYRGFVLARLQNRFSTVTAILIGCAGFGLLHWAGGFWYIVLTGLVAGGLFSGLFVWRRNIVAAFAAHLALNLIEFIFIAVAG